MSEVGDDIIEGLKNALAHARGNTAGSRTHVVEVPVIDVKALRQKLSLSQDEFALVLRVSAGTVRRWEQGRCRPEGPARALLQVLDREPEAAIRALADDERPPATPPPVAEPSPGGEGPERSGPHRKRAWAAARGRS